MLIGTAVATITSLTVVNATAGYASDPMPTATPALTASPDAPPASSTIPSPSPSPTPSPRPSTTPTQRSTPPSPTRSDPAERKPHTAKRLAGSQLDTVAASPGVVLTATSFEALGLTYVGTFTISGQRVLRFSATSGSLTGMSLTEGCAGGVATVMTSNSASLGASSFDALSLAVTLGDTPLTFNADNPPTEVFPATILLADVTLTATTMSSDKLTAPSFTTHASTC
jgi:hypothetical protein